MEYNWNMENIINSRLSDKEKEILIAELRGRISSNDKYGINKNDDISLRSKLIHYLIKYKLNSISSELYNESTSFYKDIPQDIIQDINFPKMDINNDYLASIVNSYINTFDDFKLKQIILYILNPDNNVLRIKNNLETFYPITRYVEGRVFKNLDKDFIVGSYYINNNLLDVPLFTHEIGHMISGYLFKNNINPLFYNYLRECEAYYFEILMDYYLGNKYNNDDVNTMLRSKRLVKIYDASYAITLQDIILKNNYDIDKVLSSIDNKNIVLNNNTIKKVYSSNAYDLSGIVISYLVALYLVDITLKDKHEGLDTLKSMFLDKETNLNKLLDKYGYFDHYEDVLNKEINTCSNCVKKLIK